MGAVYRVYDRLTGHTVALKRITVNQESVKVAGQTLPAGKINLRVALAQEFRTLASLRHPNIISVLDYGFENAPHTDEQQPYFTMELVENALTLADVTSRMSFDQKITLLTHILQALAYLHRRGIIHRDLKPGNILIGKEQTKVVDFGLAMVNQTQPAQDDAVVGTIAYMAPEVLQGARPTTSSDLYAVGVIAYELFAGQHPFALDNFMDFLEQLLNNDADISRLDAPQPLAALVGRLLHRDPNQRYQQALDVIDDLLEITDQPIPLETRRMRESFLQAARFVGRETEMNTLFVALHQAINGNGSSWLITGESGVGKSRLLDEIRIQALVEGTIVLRGQSIRETGLIYKPWRDVMRRIILTLNINDLEAGILREIIPDIPTLLEREIPPVATLEGYAGQRRLTTTIVDVFKRAQQSILLLLEDLHWASESLGPLYALNQLVPVLPLIIIGTYRTTDHHQPEEDFSGMEILHLERLNATSIATLTESMLGHTQNTRDVITLLQRETAGNAFFIIEVVRALAEDAGRLANIGSLTLPSHIVTGGIKAVLRYRLDQVPAEAVPLLKLAAISGRNLDTKIIGRLTKYTDNTLEVEQWLSLCAEAAVLEVREEQWRFTHDELREALIRDLEDERPKLHRQVAETIEAIYPDDDTWSSVLVEHWQAAGIAEKTIHHAQHAGERALLIGAFREGEMLLKKVLDHETQQGIRPELLPLLQLMGALNWRMSAYDQAGWYYAQSLSLASEMDDAGDIAEALNGLSFLECLKGNYVDAYELAEDALKFAQSGESVINIARALSNLGIVAEGNRDYDHARNFYQESLQRFEDAENTRGIASTLNNLGSIADSIGEYAEAAQYYQRSLTLCRSIGYRHGISTLLNNMGILSERLQADTDAWRCYQESLQISIQIGDQRGCAHAYTNMIFTAIKLGKIADARRFAVESLNLISELDIDYIRPHVLAGIAWLRLLDGEIQSGAELLGTIAGIPNLDHDFLYLRFTPLTQRFEAAMSATAYTQAVQRGQEHDLQNVLKALQGAQT